MNALRRWWRDWKRGYSDADIASMRVKVWYGKPGVADFSTRELRAYIDIHVERRISKGSL